MKTSEVRTASTPAPRPARPQETPAAAEPKDTHEPGLLAKGTGTVVGLATGTAGAVYGGVKGLVHGTMATPAVTKKGVEIGANVLRPVGHATGATVAVGLIGLTAAAGVIGTVGGTLVGGLAGGVSELSSRAPSMTRGAATAAAKGGATVGSAVLGAVGGALGTLVGLCTLPTILYPPFGLRVIPQAVRGGAVAGWQGGNVAGRYLGGAVGGLAGGAAGLTAAAVTSVPGAARGAFNTGAKGVEFMTNLPQLSGEIWNGTKDGFGQGAAVLGGTLGGVLGAGAAVVNVPWQGVAQAAETGLEWGAKGYNSLAGPPSERPESKPS